MPVTSVHMNDVLFALYAAEALLWPDLNRTNFQKILYFAATLAPLDGINWQYAFTNGTYGPFNEEIHQAPAILAQRGYAGIANIKLQRDNKIRTNYVLTQDGEQRVQQICKLRIEKKRCDWICQIMRVLDIYGQPVITKLAYKEPTFAQMRRQNRRGVIDLSPGENLSLDLINSLRERLLGAALFGGAQPG